MLVGRDVSGHFRPYLSAVAQCEGGVVVMPEGGDGKGS